MRLPERREDLGPPALELAGLELWVHGRQFPDAAEVWDADWLQVTAYCAAPGARVWVSGPILGSTGLARWMAECEALLAELTNRAELHSYEPDLRVCIDATDQSGHLILAVFITPDHPSQEHRFEFAIDQSYLPPLVADLRAILATYSVPEGLLPDGRNF